jgi:hypothetical protein
MPPRRAFFQRYRPPGIDGGKAVATAVLFLTRARSIEGLTAETFARQQRLKPATAERLIAEEAQRRAGNQSEGERSWK